RGVYGLKGISTRLSLIVIATRRSIGAEPPGTVAWYVPGSGPEWSRILCTVLSAIRARRNTSAPTSGRPAGSETRTAYVSPWPHAAALVPTTSTRGKPANRGDVIRVATASGGGVLAIGLVVTSAICLGGAVARGLGTRAAALVSDAPAGAGSSRAASDEECSPRTGQDASGSPGGWTSAGFAVTDGACASGPVCWS